MIFLILSKAPISFVSTEQEIQDILNDMPNLYPNLVTVELVSNTDDELIFKVKFSSALGLHNF